MTIQELKIWAETSAKQLQHFDVCSTIDAHHVCCQILFLIREIEKRDNEIASLKINKIYQEIDDESYELELIDDLSDDDITEIK